MIEAILKEQLDLFTTLLTVLEKETDILKSGSWTEIEATVNQKALLQADLYEIEQRRLNSMDDKTLTDYEQESGQTKLTQDYRQVLNQVMEKLKENEQLTKVGYEYNATLMQLIVNESKVQVNTYGQKGNVYSQQVTPSLLNRKV